MSKRTDVDWSKHELKITKNDHVMIHDLKNPNSLINRVRFINTCGIMAVNGDFGNWIFCREFHPYSEFGGVCDSYWCEKLRIASTQEPSNYDSEATRKALLKELNEDYKDHEYNLKEEHEWLKYIKGCLSCVDDELEYKYYAYREYPSFCDHECVIFVKDINYWLKVVFDAFEEICKRLK
jgi:hypothetical protein